MSRTLIERYWAAQDPYDPSALARLRHLDWSAEWPQSAERIPTHEADVAIHTSYPGYPAHRLERLAGSDEVWRALPTIPMFTLVRISGASDFWIGEARLEYPDQGTWNAVLSLEFRDGLAWRETEWFCRGSETAPWPATYPEPAPASPPAISASMEHDASAEGRHVGAYQDYAALAAIDPAAAAAGLFHASAVIDRPQFGRRVSGLPAIERAQHQQREVLPGRMRRVVASGHVLLAESELDHAGAAWFLLSILEFEGDQVARAVEYLAESYDPPEWRRPWTEPLPTSA